MATRAHMCATYSTIGAFKFGLGNLYLNSPFPFSLHCVEKLCPSSAISSPFQITFDPCPIRAISWPDHSLSWLISPLPQCPRGMNPLPMQIFFPFPNLHNAKRCFCAQVGGHFCLTCKATVMASPCNSPSISMGRQRAWGLFPLGSQKSPLLQPRSFQGWEIDGSKTTSCCARVIIGFSSPNSKTFQEKKDIPRNG